MPKKPPVPRECRFSQWQVSQGEALIAADCLRSGFSQWQAVHHVNAWREKRGKPSVSRTCVRDAVNRLGAKRYRRARYRFA